MFSCFPFLFFFQKPILPPTKDPEFPLSFPSPPLPLSPPSPPPPLPSLSPASFLQSTKDGWSVFGERGGV